LSKPYTPLILIMLGAFIYGMWNYAQLMLLVMSAAYVISGIAIRVGGLLRRRIRHPHPTATPEGQIG
jgi:CDP-diacylglycerol--serine O-phosphatidyltransferase